jgi:hypothetical protein
MQALFFRSGYIILKRCKRAALTEEQALRLATVIQKREDWRKLHPRR